MRFTQTELCGTELQTTDFFIKVEDFVSSHGFLNVNYTMIWQHFLTGFELGKIRQKTADSRYPSAIVVTLNACHFCVIGL